MICFGYLLIALGRLFGKAVLKKICMSAADAWVVWEGYIDRAADVGLHSSIMEIVG
jgi:hypothetical protein